MPLQELSRVFTTFAYDCDMGEQSFGEWLLWELNRRDWSQSDFVRRAGLSGGVVSNWINGDRRPKYESCLKIARALGVDPDLVVTKAGRMPATQLRDRPMALADLLRQFELVAPIQAPLIELDQLVSAGPGEAVPQGYEYMAPNGEARRSPLYAAVVTGTCMDPEIRPGDRVVFDPHLPVEHGRLVVASVEGEEAVVKRLVVRGDKRYLEALDGKRLLVDERVRFVGVVTEVRRRV